MKQKRKGSGAVEKGSRDQERSGRAGIKDGEHEQGIKEKGYREGFRIKEVKRGKSKIKIKNRIKVKREKQKKEQNQNQSQKKKPSPNQKQKTKIKFKRSSMGSFLVNGGKTYTRRT